MPRYRISQEGTKWRIRWKDTSCNAWRWLGNQYDADSAELAGRTVDALVAMDLLNRERVT